MGLDIDSTQIDETTLPFSAGVQGTTASSADSPVSGDTQASGSSGVSDAVASGSAVGGSGGAAATAPADPNVGSGVASGASAAPQSWQSIREAAQQMYGYQFDPSITDDRAALSHLIQQAQKARQANYYAQVGQAIVPHASELQQFLASKQQPQSPAKSVWDKPEFDPRWAALVQYDDASGAFIGKAANVPAEVVRAANDYASWRDRVSTDPAGYQEHLFTQKFVPQIRQMIAGERESIKREAVVENIVRQNSSWLYAAGESGEQILGQDGRPMLSPAGRRYAEIITELHGSGITDPVRTDSMARRMLSLEIENFQLRGNQTGAAPQQTRAATGQPSRNIAGTQPPTRRASDPAAVEPTSAGLNMRDLLARQMDLEGITDADIGFD